MVEVAESAEQTPLPVESDEERSFRLRLREWLAKNARPRGSRGGEADGGEGLDTPRGGIAAAKDFMRGLYDAGFGGITYPTQYGGQGLDNRFQKIVNEELGRFDTPRGPFAIGLGMCAPTILTHGTEEQKTTYLPRMLRGDDIWCQLFSEPGAGSDVASLTTRAERSGDEWVLNGQKVWTSGAQYSEHGILIARTDWDVPKHQGITMFIVDMKAPGVSVRPLKQITGDSSFNEVFFDDVRLPADAVLGEQGGGWRAAITTLMNERVAVSGGGTGGRTFSLFDAAKRFDLSGDRVVRQRVMDVYVRSAIVRYIGQRVQAQLKAGIVPGPEGSIVKLATALLQKQSADVAAAMAGARAVAWDADAKGGDRWAQGVLGGPMLSIAGGTNEVQRNIIGERVLGLPKEPQVDRDVAFREVRTSAPGARRED